MSQKLYQFLLNTAAIFYTLKALLSKNRFYFFFSFFSSSNMQKFHHLLGCHAIGINLSLMFFFKFFAFSKFNMSSQKSDKNNSIRIIFVIMSIVKVNIIKVFFKNTHFITRKYDISRIFNKIEYIFVCLQRSKKYFNHFTCNKPIRNKF